MNHKNLFSISVFLILLILPVSQAIASENLIGYWKFDEGSGNIAKDSSGLENNGIIMNSEYVDGMTGKALKFTNESDYIIVPHNSNFYNSEITLSVWIKPFENQSAGQRYRVIVGKDGNMNDRNNSYSLYWDSYEDKVMAFVRWNDGKNNVYKIKSSLIEPDFWHNIVMTKGRKMKLYVDNILVGEKETPNPLPWNSKPIMIGTGNANKKNNQNFVGVVDEIKIWNRTLTKQEIFDNYFNLVGYWKFDGNVNDSGGNWNHGTIHGNISFEMGKFDQALNFNGYDNYVEIPDSDVLDFGVSDFTVSFWVNTTDFRSPGTIISKLNKTGYSIALYRFGSKNETFNTRIVLTIGGDKDIGARKIMSDEPSEEKIADGNWHHLAVLVLRNKKELRFFIDGLQLGEAVNIFTNGSLDNNVSMIIGAESNHLKSYQFRGVIDDVKLFSRDLASVTTSCPSFFLSRCPM
ncbi:MAG: LamG domain-containing protein [Candidatus Aenigmarchaeota archaeon]|nr:LamG domain-containing protein [Candidatus Aenigmarchaeota archaeon]